MKEDYNKIKILIDKNEYFYDKKLIKKKIFIRNSLILADKLDVILSEGQRLYIKDFFTDEYSIIKFMLIINMLKATPN